MKAFLFLLLFLMPFSPLEAGGIESTYADNEVIYKQYQRYDGLSADEIYDLKFDSLGILWIASNEGIYRFDGQHFFQPKMSNFKGPCTGLCFVEKEKVLFTDMSAGVYQASPDEVQKIDIRFPEHIQIPRFISQPRGRRFILTFDGTYRWDKHVFRYDSSLSANSFIQHHDRLFLLRDNELRQVNEDLETIKSYPFHNSVQKGFRMSGISSDRGVLVYASHSEKLYRIDGDSLKQFQNLQQPVLCMASFENTLYVGTRNGLDIYTWQHGKFVFSKRLFSGVQISSILVDERKQIWIGSLGDGLFRVYDTDLVKWHLPDTRDYVKAIYRHRGQIYLGTQKGRVFQFDEDKGLRTISEAIRVIGVNGFFEDARGRLLVSCDKLYEVQEQGLKPAFEAPSYLNLVLGINLLYEKDDSTIIYNGYSGLGKIQLGDDEHLSYLNRSRSRSAIRQEEHLLLANGQGLFAFDARDEQFDTLLGPGDAGGRILQMNAGFLYHSPARQHFFLFDKDLQLTKKFSDYPDIGRPLAAFQRAQDLLIVGERGFFLYNDTLGPQKADLLPGLAFDKIQACYQMGPRLFLAQKNELILLDIEQFYPGHAAPKPHFLLKQLTIDKVPDTAISLRNLPHDARSLDLRFELINFESSVAPTLFYSLSHIQHQFNWTPLPSGERELSISNIASGSQFLHIATGMEPELALQSFQIFKNPPFWQKTWFYLLCFSTGILFALPVFQYISRYRNRKQAEKLERAQLEKSYHLSNLKSLKAQLNPHFIFNALNAIQSFILKNDRLQASNYLNRFALLMRTVLQHSMDDFINLKEELDTIQIYLDLENLRFNGEIETSIELGKDIDSSQIKIPAMLIQPFVENAIKHGLSHKEGSKKLSLKLAPLGDMLQVEIEDNGIGREAAQAMASKKEHLSVSEGINRKRLDVINRLYDHQCRIEFEDKIDTNARPLGTLARIFIPIQRI